MTSDFMDRSDRRRQVDCEHQQREDAQRRKRERAEREAGRRLEGALAAARAAAADVFFATLKDQLGTEPQVRLMLSATLNCLTDECVATRTIFLNMDGTEPTEQHQRLSMALGALKAVAPDTFAGIEEALVVAERVIAIKAAAEDGDENAAALLRTWQRAG